MTLGRAGAEIEFSCEGGSRAAYLVLPASGRGRGVLVVQEAWGLVDSLRDACDRLAREGFVALAPDLYRGETAADPDQARRLMARLEIDRAVADLDGAVSALFNHDAVDGTKVGAVGFCMGGYLALLAAARNRRIGAVADFYGFLPGVTADLSALEASVLGVFAEHDEFVSPEAVRALRAELEAAGKRVTFEIQPGARHGFMNAARPDVYDAATAARGWDALLAFLRAELR